MGEKLESQLNQLQHAKGTDKVDLLLEISNHYLNEDLDKCLDYAQQAKQAAEESGYELQLAHSNRLIGIANMYLGNDFQTIRHLNNAIQLFSKLGHRRDEGTMLNMLAVHHAYHGEYDLSLELNLKSVDILESLEDRTDLIGTYNNFGILYRKMNDLDNAYKYYRKALDVIRETGQESFLSNTLGNLGVVSTLQAKYSEAEQYHTQSLGLSIRNNDLKGIAEDHGNLGVTYTSLGEFGKAEEHHLESLRIRQQVNDQRGIAVTYSNLGSMYGKQGNLQKGLETLHKAQVMMEEIEDRPQQAVNLRKLYAVYQEKGDYKSALEAFIRASRIENELMDENRAAHLAVLETRYKTEKKEREAEIYRLKTVELEELVVQRTQELKEKHEQLLHSSRLASLGEMATGIVHELSQPLAVIFAEAEMIGLEARNVKSLGGEICGHARGIIKNVERAAELIDNMKHFSRRDIDINPSTEIVETVEKTMDFFRRQFHIHNIDLLTKFALEKFIAPVPARYLEQITVNFLNNARYAVEKRAETATGEYRKQVTVKLYQPEKNTHVVFEIIDNGTGMTKTEQKQCTEPFYTTKPADSGTGLGLSIVKGLISEFDGKLQVQSKRGFGTTMRVLIPV